MPTIQDRPTTPILALCQHAAGILIMLILSLILAAGGTMQAQPSECSTVPCTTPVLIFSGTESYKITGGSCIIDVTYKVYDMCGIIEITIDRVSWNANPPCDGGTISGLIYIAYREIMEQNFHNLPPSAPNRCYDGLRGTSTMCWNFHTGTVGPLPDQNTIFPCGTSGCCTQTFKVCTDEEGKRSATRTGQMNFGSCPGGCTPACNDEALRLSLGE